MNNKYKLLKLFPYLDDPDKIDKLKIDNESLSYISIREDADIITKIIQQHTNALDIPNNELIITDATAGVGGNVLSFCKYFHHVNAIEINKLRCDYLKSNIDIFGFQNVNIYNEDCAKILNTLHNHHIIFLDPPWGGKSYKKHTNLRFNISNIPIELICNNMMDKTKTKSVPSLVVLKLPKNYDLNYFNKYINSNKIYIHNLKKMIIIVVYCDSKITIL